MGHVIPEIQSGALDSLMTGYGWGPGDSTDADSTDAISERANSQLDIYQTDFFGRSQLAAIITKEAVVLSHPHINTTPSMGFPHILSSTSIPTRFRKSIAVGRRLVSPVDITGNLRGKPPASDTPYLTRSARA
jgi:hypothetical protein